jgi:uncharacterized membrane protein YphA (DoxX/SURF4 family)
MVMHTVLAAGRVALGLETMRHGVHKVQDWPEFSTILSQSGPWGPPVVAPLAAMPQAATDVLAITGVTVQTIAGVCVATGFMTRPACVVLEAFMGVATHWHLVSRGRPAWVLFDTDCDGKGPGAGYFMLGYGALLLLGPGRLFR